MLVPAGDAGSAPVSHSVEVANGAGGVCSGLRFCSAAAL